MPQPKPSPERLTARLPTIRIASLMLLIALFAVFLGLWQAGPWLAIVVSIPAGALIRTWLATRSSPEPPSPQSLAQTFLMTFGAIVIIVISSFSAFLVTCLAAAGTFSGLNTGYLGLWVGLGVGGISGIYVAFVLIRYALQSTGETKIVDAAGEDE